MLKNYITSLLVFFLLSLQSLSVKAQNDSISILKVFQMALEKTSSDTLKIENQKLSFEGLQPMEDGLEFYDTYTSQYELLGDALKRLNPNVKTDSLGRVKIECTLIFDACNLPDIVFDRLNFNAISFESCTQKSSGRIEDFSNGIQITHCQFTTLTAVSNAFNFMVLAENRVDSLSYFLANEIHGDLDILENEFMQSLWMEQLIVSEDCKVIKVANNEFYPIHSDIKLPKELNPNGFTQNLLFNLSFDSDAPFLLLRGNEFKTNSPYDRVIINGLLQELYIDQNSFEAAVSLSCTVEKKFILSWNEFNSFVDIINFVPPEVYNTLSFESLKGYKLVSAYLESFDDTLLALGWSEEKIDAFNKAANFETVSYYQALTKEELNNMEGYKDLITSYYRLYDIFKGNGDIISANDIYIEMKEVESRFLRIQALEHWTFNHWFRWGLNRLLYYYTAHGTDPAKAIVASFFVILIFGFIYFLLAIRMPYDVKKDYFRRLGFFAHKNKKWIYRFRFWMVVFADSIALSINSYITLGFGKIPQYGFSKYLTILEGFIGWFLLSIFTVALINQVLF